MALDKYLTKYPTFNYYVVPQRSEDWHRLRLGKITASKFKDVIATAKRPKKDADGELYYPYLDSRESYKKELVAERIVGMLGHRDVYQTPAMLWGQMNEAQAALTYQLRTGNKVTEAGFAVLLDEKGKELPIGVSSDGLIGDDGNLEIKSLEPHNHLYNVVKEYEQTHDMPDDYKAQVQGQMLVQNRSWTDFVGHDSRMPAGLDLLAVRVERDDDYCEYLLAELLKFADEVERDFKNFLRYLPVCERTCRQCGTVFTDKLALCPEDGSGNTLVSKMLAPAELQLSSLKDLPQVAA